jgi:copper chaperone
MRAMVFVLLVSLGAGCSRQAPPVPPKPAEAVIPVEGMTCGGCEQTLQEGVGKLAGVSSVRASHKEKKAWVRYDAARIAPDRIVDAIVKLGYRARVPSPTP